LKAAGVLRNTCCFLLSALITEKQLVPRKSVTEQRKGAKSNAVGQRVNNIRDQAVEEVNNDLIYT
jgi:hypothetical protein